MARDVRPAGHGSSAAVRDKDAIDRGLTGDKVPGFDPGAAPLGTDDESAGTTTPAAVQPQPRAARHQAAALAADASGTDRSRYRAQDRLVWPVIVALSLLLAGGLVLLLFAG